MLCGEYSGDGEVSADDALTFLSSTLDGQSESMLQWVVDELDTECAGQIYCYNQDKQTRIDSALLVTYTAETSNESTRLLDAGWLMVAG